MYQLKKRIVLAGAVAISLSLLSLNAREVHGQTPALDCTQTQNWSEIRAIRNQSPQWWFQWATRWRLGTTEQLRALHSEYLASKNKCIAFLAWACMNTQPLIENTALAKGSVGIARIGKAAAVPREQIIKTQGLFQNRLKAHLETRGTLSRPEWRSMAKVGEKHFGNLWDKVVADEENAEQRARARQHISLKCLKERKDVQIKRKRNAFGCQGEPFDEFSTISKIARQVIADLTEIHRKKKSEGAFMKYVSRGRKVTRYGNKISAKDASRMIKKGIFQFLDQEGWEGGPPDGSNIYENPVIFCATGVSKADFTLSVMRPGDPGASGAYFTFAVKRGKAYISDITSMSHMEH